MLDSPRSDARANESQVESTSRRHRRQATGSPRGRPLFLKCEKLQKTGSFKARGALNKVGQLTDRARRRRRDRVGGESRASAGVGGRAAGVHATVVMYAAASPAKVEASRGYGAEVILHGTSGSDAFARARELAEQRASCSSIRSTTSTFARARERLPSRCSSRWRSGRRRRAGRRRRLDHGNATALKESRPSIRVYGVEPTGAPRRVSASIAATPFVSTRRTRLPTASPRR